MYKANQRNEFSSGQEMKALKLASHSCGWLACL